MVSVDEVVEIASSAAFGRPLILNSLRSWIVEAIPKAHLTSDWNWTASDWAGWDFEHADGTRVEVKQSAARQSWTGLPKKVMGPRFDIAGLNSIIRLAAGEVAYVAPGFDYADTIEIRSDEIKLSSRAPR